MQIEDNWTDVDGEIIDVRPSLERPEFVEIAILVEQAKPVEDFKSFLGDRVGQSLVVKVKRAWLQPLPAIKGAHISLRVRRGERPTDIFADSKRISIRPR